jgi:hypothetical protein
VTPALNDTLLFGPTSAVFELPLPDALAHAARVSPVSTAHAAIASFLGLVIGGTSPFTGSDVRLASSRIERVTQPVTEKVEGHDRDKDR